MRGAGMLPVSPGVSPVTTCSMTISRPRAQKASSASAWRPRRRGCPRAARGGAAGSVSGRMPGLTSSSGAVSRPSRAPGTWPMPGRLGAAQAHGERIDAGLVDQEPHASGAGAPLSSATVEAVEGVGVELGFAGALAYVHDASVPAGRRRERPGGLTRSWSAIALARDGDEQRQRVDLLPGVVRLAPQAVLARMERRAPRRRAPPAAARAQSFIPTSSRAGAAPHVEAEARAAEAQRHADALPARAAGAGR